MKKGAILINAYVVYESVKNQVERLKEEFSILGVSLDVISNQYISVYIKDGTVENILKDYDFIINLDKDVYISMMLEKAGMKVFNSTKSLQICDDKMWTYIALAQHNIRMPMTISAPLCYKDVEPSFFLQEVETKLFFPLVAKECYGSLGEQIYLIHNHEELQEIEAKLHFKPHLYQEYIESSKGRDVRVIVIGHHAVAWMERYSDKDFRSNIAQGGKARKIQPPSTFIQLAEEVSKILELDYCGVDLLYGKEKEPILCEVNSNAFFKGIEKVTGVNVAASFASYIYQAIYVDKKKKVD